MQIFGLGEKPTVFASAVLKSNHEAGAQQAILGMIVLHVRREVFGSIGR